jgi:hypothetical protein
MQPIFDAPAPADSSNRVGKALMSIPTFQLRLPSGTRSLLVAVLSVQRFKGTQRRQSLNRTRLSACNCLLICAASLLLGPVSSLACRDIDGPKSRLETKSFGNSRCRLAERICQQSCACPLNMNGCRASHAEAANYAFERNPFDAPRDF